MRKGSYCEDHEKLYQARRGTSSQRGYGSNWRKLRKIFLNANPICKDPYGLHPDQVVATNEVDHILPRERGGTDETSNLQALCKQCHSHKTAVEDGRWG